MVGRVKDVLWKSVQKHYSVSKGFGNRVRQWGKETYKLELTNKNYN
jgi:hypothetical protein